MFLPGLFDGVHIFEIVKKNNKTVFIHHEKFKGIFSAIILKMLTGNTKNSFKSMNEALKEFAENN